MKFAFPILVAAMQIVSLPAAAGTVAVRVVDAAGQPAAGWMVTTASGTG